MSTPDSYDPYALPPDALEDPPSTLWQALRKIGPGIILTGSIVGSGELIQTTTLGAKWGFAFLWLILFSCLIKVFVQIELGRYAISSGKPTLGALNELPGPRLGAHWLVWWWLFMLLATVFQLGAMVGAVGQALHLAFPGVNASIERALEGRLPMIAESLHDNPAHSWGILVALSAIGLLMSGGYRRLELITTILVAAVTLFTVAGMAALPWAGHPIKWDEIGWGLSSAMLSIPAAGVAAAFSTFGITGVGASELYSYPYWCLEKGYARSTGKNSPGDDWVRRAKGWMRVMHLDAWVSMVVFTLATVAFYVMGAVVLHNTPGKDGVPPLVPDSKNMVDELSKMYTVFGEWTIPAFIVGACVVLFKTLYVASAGHSRLTADFFSLAGWVQYPTAKVRTRWIRGLCVFYPLLALLFYFLLKNPRTLVLIGGVAQGVTLPVISLTALYLRYKRCDKRIAPSRAGDVVLWVAVLLIAAAAAYAVPVSIWDAMKK